MLAGCSEGSDTSIPDNARQDSDIDTLKMRLKWAEERIASMQYNAHPVLTPDEKGYQHLSDGAINLTVALTEFRQKGSAVEVALKVGNLTSATLKDCSAFVAVRKTKDGEFGAPAPQKFDRPLSPAAWTDVTVTLADQKVADISALRLSTVGCNIVSLSN